MPYTSHHFAFRSAPHYGLAPRAPMPDARTEGAELARALSRCVRAEDAASPAQLPPFPCNATRRPATDTSRQPSIASRPSSSGTPWAAAFAILLVANLATPAHSGVAKREAATPPDPSRDGDEIGLSHAPVDESPLPDSSTSHSVGDVRIEQADAPRIKSDYTLADLFHAIGAAGHPFRHATDDLFDAFSMATGEEVNADTRRSFDYWADMIDRVTGLIPDVGLIHTIGDAADMAGDELDGRHARVDGLVSLLRLLDFRSWRRADSAQPSVRRVAPDKPPADVRIHHDYGSIPPVAWPGQSRWAVRRRPPKVEKATHRELPDAAANAQRTPVDIPRYAEEGRPDETVDGEPLGNERVAAPAPRPDYRIAGELEHLQGYAQTLSEDRWPADPQRRLVLVDGQHYLRGESGFYHVRKSFSADHWRASAPRGSEHAAEVPVIFDPATGQWRAEAPLRLCGGGCGPSRESTPDSIAIDREKVITAVAHLDERTGYGIRLAFDDLGLLHLSRSNRADLRDTRDNSIMEERAILRGLMTRSIKLNRPLIKQQSDAALITATHYYFHPYSEAFCQENAEILFHYLTQNGVSENRIRMITVQPRNRSPHVMVLYTESAHLISLLESATPITPLDSQPDGIDEMTFISEIYESRDSTVLLDPWSRVRATSFVHTSDVVELTETLDRALAEAEHVPGNPYQVSITRPLGMRRGRTYSVDSGLGSDRRSMSVSSWGTAAGQAPAGPSGEPAAPGAGAGAGAGAWTGAGPGAGTRV